MKTKFKIQELNGSFRVLKGEEVEITRHSSFWRKYTTKETGWEEWFFWASRDGTFEWKVKDMEVRNSWTIYGFSHSLDYGFESREQALEAIGYYYGKNYSLEAGEWRTV